MSALPLPLLRSRSKLLRAQSLHRTPFATQKRGSNLNLNKLKSRVHRLNCLTWRKERDSNPRCVLLRTHAFQACLFGHSSILPSSSHYKLTKGFGHLTGDPTSTNCKQTCNLVSSLAICRPAYLTREAVCTAYTLSRDSHILRPRSHCFEKTSFSSVDFLAECRWHFSPSATRTPLRTAIILQY